MTIKMAYEVILKMLWCDEVSRESLRGVLFSKDAQVARIQSFGGFSVSVVYMFERLFLSIAKAVKSR